MDLSKTSTYLLDKSFLQLAFINLHVNSETLAVDEYCSRIDKGEDIVISSAEICISRVPKKTVNVIEPSHLTYYFFDVSAITSEFDQRFTIEFSPSNDEANRIMNGQRIGYTHMLNLTSNSHFRYDTKPSMMIREMLCKVIDSIFQKSIDYENSKTEFVMYNAIEKINSI